MTESTQRLLRRLRKYHTRLFPAPAVAQPPPFDLQGEPAAARIRQLLTADAPCFIGRMGGTETELIVRYLDTTAEASTWDKSLDYIRRRRDCFWFSPGSIERLHTLSGVFPPSEDMVKKFSLRLLEDLKYLDLLGSWLAQENRLAEFYSPSLIRIPLLDLEPYRTPTPWSEILAGKKVLVIHPFDESIGRQYARRKLLFSDPRVLPDFELKTLKSIQSLGLTPPGCRDWFDALDQMCAQIDAIDYDITLIGAGAYGLPLGAHIKRRGKKAVHLGGATQVLFGIRGKRWDEDPRVAHLFNENWTRPLPQETPTTAGNVEKGCYW